MTQDKWTNYGDVNPVEHGAIFVKRDCERSFYVVSLQPMEDGGWYLIDGYIDLDDDWIHWESVKTTCDTPEDANDEALVVHCMWYYGTHLSNGERDFFQNEQDVLNRLTAMKIEI